MATLIKFININIANYVNTAQFLQKTICSQISFCNKKFYSKKKTIRRSLGIPEPPKKPKNAFMRFVDTLKLTIKPTGQRDLVKLASEQWKSLSDEQKKVHYEGYEDALALYKEALANYNKNVDKSQIEEIEKQLKERELKMLDSIERRNSLKLLYDLGKPKQPPNGYSIFISDHKGEHLSSTIAKWSKLPENDKNKYKQKAEQLRHKYKLELNKWEAKMVAIGRGHLVRKNFLETHRSKKTKKR